MDRRTESEKLIEAAERFLDWQERMMELRRQQKVERIIKAGRKRGKVSFRDLKMKFEKEGIPISQMDSYKRLMLETWFEINGNLDSISLSLRALVQMADEERIKRNKEENL